MAEMEKPEVNLQFEIFLYNDCCFCFSKSSCNCTNIFFFKM